MMRPSSLESEEELVLESEDGGEGGGCGFAFGFARALAIGLSWQDSHGPPTTYIWFPITGVSGPAKSFNTPWQYFQLFRGLQWY